MGTKPEIPLRFGVCSLATGESAEWRKLRDLTFANKSDYCAKHGYTFISESHSLDDSRPASWSKIKLVLREMRTGKYDWLFWSDADSLILNPLIRLESLVSDDADFLISADHNGINAGQFLVRCCQECQTMLEAAYARTEYINDPWWEQKAIARQIGHGLDGRLYPAHGMRPRLIHKTLINSDLTDYRPGHFILHLGGSFDDGPSKSEILTAFAAGNVKLIYE